MSARREAAVEDIDAYVFVVFECISCADEEYEGKEVPLKFLHCNEAVFEQITGEDVVTDDDDQDGR